MAWSYDPDTTAQMVVLPTVLPIEFRRGGNRLPLGLFLWPDLCGSKNHGGIANIYIRDEITYSPFFGLRHHRRRIGQGVGARIGCIGQGLGTLAGVHGQGKGPLARFGRLAA